MMRVIFAASLAALCVLAMPNRSFAQVSLDGFGALPMNQLSSLGESGVPFDFGGRVGFEIAPAVQVIGEFGRLGDVMPDFVETGLVFSTVDLRVSAFYGEGGVRLLAAPRSAVSPYVEGSAGVAHLRFGINGLGSASDAVVRNLLNLVDSRDPIVGAGGGIQIQGGPLRLDLGYRYKRVLANTGLASYLALGQDLESHQVRFGVGVRF
jgi:hypothetical protein